MFKQLLNAVKNPVLWVNIVIALVMLNNIEHLAYVHHRIARLLFPTCQMNWWHSILVVIIIELSIIVLVNKGQKAFALVYTLMLFVLSLIYYPLDQYWINGQYGLFCAAIVYSLMFTISIYYFACMAAERSWENGKIMTLTREKDKAAAELQELRAALHESEKKLQETETELQEESERCHELGGDLTRMIVDEVELRKQLQQANNELHQLRNYRQQIEAKCTCERCGQTFESEASKRSHTGKCKGKGMEVAA